MKQYQVISRDEVEKLMKEGRLKPAFLYEPDNAPKGTKFVLADFGPAVGLRLSRIVDRNS